MPERIPLDPLTFGEHQTCFGCGPHNHRGWKLRFAREGDTVVTTFTPREGEDGPPGIFHGGLQATLADELAAWTLVGLKGRMGFTTSMQVRLMRPIRVGQEIVGRGRVVSEHGRVVTLSVTLEQAGKVGMKARIAYHLPDAATVERALGRPLPDTWRRLCE